MGLSGILMNAVRCVIIYIGQKSGRDDNYFDTLVFYLINTFFEILAASMYFVEIKNTYSRFHNSRIRIMN